MSRYFPYMCRIKLWMKQPDILTDSFIVVLQFFFLLKSNWEAGQKLNMCHFCPALRILNTLLGWNGRYPDIAPIAILPLCKTVKPSQKRLSWKL